MRARSVSRRRFLTISGMTAAATACGNESEDRTMTPCGMIAGENASRVSMAGTGSPERNAAATLDAWGGVESLVGPEDLVILKPNSQWYCQGMTNTDVLVAMIEAILARPGGFRGEVIVADNHHFRDDDARGWTTDQPNGRVNLNGVVELFRNRGETRVAKVHWHDAGPNPNPWQFDAGWGTRVDQPGDGDGYRWQLDQCHITEAGNKCAMTWPVFMSPVSGDIVDLKDGVFRAGTLTGRPLKLINVSSINHHSRYAGVTASVKNLMGIVDMTCGFHGPEPDGFCNTHYIGLKSSHAVWRFAERSISPVKRLLHRILPEHEAIDFHHTGGALGHWMRAVRRPDLHIVTAEWIGWGSRTHAEMCARPGLVFASTDAVSVDAVAAREALLPATRAAGAAAAGFLRYNDVDNHDGPFRRFLAMTQREIGGTLDPQRTEIVRLS
jgi:uncharacterized protein (DUF362 family)